LPVLIVPIKQLKRLAAPIDIKGGAESRDKFWLF